MDSKKVRSMEENLIISNILSLVSMVKPYSEVIIMQSSSPLLKSCSRHFLTGCYMRLGRCVIKIDFSTTASPAIRAQVRILRNTLIAFLAFQKYLRRRKLDRLGLVQKAQLSVIVRLTEKKYSRTSLKELLNTVVSSPDVRMSMFYAFPKIIYLQSSQNVLDIVKSLSLNYSLFMEPITDSWAF